MKFIEFSVPGGPHPKGRPRFSRKSGFAYTPTKTRHAEESFVALAAQHRPEKPITTAIRLQLSFSLPIPQSKSKKAKAAMAAGDTPHTKRPDLDNLCKLVKDAMNGIFWMDDKQVTALVACKQYDETPQTQVTMSWWEDE